MEYDFTLKFILVDGDHDADALVERLGAAGCDDALVGIGMAGKVALNFTREAGSAREAVFSAMADAGRAMPNAVLAEVGPDFVGLTDVAELLGVSRQYLRKLRVENADFPVAVHEGKSAFWHLLDVLNWLREKKNLHIPEALPEVAGVARRINADIEAGVLEQALLAWDEDAGRAEYTLWGDPQGLQFELITGAATLGEGVRGGLRVLLDGEPVWFAEGDDGHGIPLICDLPALLTFLGDNWPWLVLEEDYPLPLPTLHPAYFLQDAESRWRDLSASQVAEEKKLVSEFLGRHDLARIFSKSEPVSLVLMRQGETCHISVGSRTRIKTWGEIKSALEAMGQYLANFLVSSTGERERRALEAWRTRNSRLEAMELDLTTGLSAELRGRLPEVDWHAAEIRAVARMSRRDVRLAQQKEILERIAGVGNRQTPELDRLAAAIMEVFREEGRPHEQGCCVARQLRRELGLDAHDVVEPEQYLRRWGVEIDDFALEACPVEAVTAWGERYGPVVLVNRSEDSRAGHEYGRRVTLAHEIGHLLIDRKRALPAGEVLGGAAPEYPEKRARAFAAEFLLPQDVAASAVRNHASLEEAASFLQVTYRVSRELLAWQIYNSGVSMSFGHEENVLLEQWKKTTWRLKHVE